MQKDTPQAIENAKTANRNARDKCIRKLFLLSLAVTIVVTILLGFKVPNQDFGSARYIGSMIGSFIVIFLSSSLSFAVVRLARDASVLTAGLGTGVVIALLMSVNMYYSALRDLEEHFGAAPVEDIESMQR